MLRTEPPPGRLQLQQGAGGVPAPGRLEREGAGEAVRNIALGRSVEAEQRHPAPSLLLSAPAVLVGAVSSRCSPGLCLLRPCRLGSAREGQLRWQDPKSPGSEVLKALKVLAPNARSAVLLRAQGGPEVVLQEQAGNAKLPSLRERRSVRARLKALPPASTQRCLNPPEPLQGWVRAFPTPHSWRHGLLPLEAVTSPGPAGTSRGARSCVVLLLVHIPPRPPPALLPQPPAPLHLCFVPFFLEQRGQAPCRPPGQHVCSRQGPKGAVSGPVRRNLPGLFG